MGKLRLLCIGPGGVPTGYSRVLDTLMSNMHPNFDITHFAVNRPRYPQPLTPYRFVPNQMLGDIFGKEQIPSLLEEIQPDLVLLCHDPGFWAVHRPILQAYKSRFNQLRTIFYCPIEWSDMLPGVIAGLSGMDRLVLYTKFARDTVRSICLQHNLPLPLISVIPHGIDHGVFYPLIKNNLEASRIYARQKLFPNRPELKNAFIVLNANRNVPRKKINLSLQGFAAFYHNNKPANAYLYLHMGMRDTGCDILCLAQEIGISERLLLSTLKDAPPRINDDHLNLIYNACDVGINTSTGEGWGLVATEHAACGGIQIVPNHSACAELWGKYGVLIALDASQTASCGEISIAGLAEALNSLYLSPEQRKELSDLALKFANQPNISWQKIARQWEQLLWELAFSPS